MEILQPTFHEIQSFYDSGFKWLWNLLSSLKQTLANPFVWQDISSIHLSTKDFICHEVDSIDVKILKQNNRHGETMKIPSMQRRLVDAQILQRFSLACKMSNLLKSSNFPHLSSTVILFILAMSVRLEKMKSGKEPWRFKVYCQRIGGSIMSKI